MNLNSFDYNFHILKDSGIQISNPFLFAEIQGEIK